MQVANPGTGHQLPIQQAFDDLGMVAHVAAVQFGGDARGVVVIQESAWRQHFQQQGRPSGHHHHAGAGGHQNQGATSARILKRVLLSERPAPGQTEHVDLAANAELAQHQSHYHGKIGKPIRQRRIR